VDERPVIVVVDDEADALSAIRNALTRRFGGDYRVVSRRSARTALDDICAIKEKGGEIALVISDQRMPEMTGRDFLGRVRSIMPMAKRALLVDWGDHDASPTVLQACALGELSSTVEHEALGSFATVLTQDSGNFMRPAPSIASGCLWRQTK
jgi:DNA-binding NtrC family response regulator